MIPTIPGWGKSSYSGTENACVEICPGRMVGVRDTKNRAAGQLTVSAATWRAFVAHAKRHG